MIVLYVSIFSSLGLSVFVKLKNVIKHLVSSSGLICSCMNLLQKSLATRTLGRERNTVQEMRRSQRQFTLLLLFHFKAHGLSQCQGWCTVLNLQLHPGSALKCKKQDRKDTCKEMQSVIRKWRHRVTSPDQVVQEASSRMGN